MPQLFGNTKTNPHHPKGYYWSAGLKFQVFKPIKDGQERRAANKLANKALKGLTGYCQTEDQAIKNMEAAQAIALKEGGDPNWFDTYECMPL